MTCEIGNSEGDTLGEKGKICIRQKMQCIHGSRKFCEFPPPSYTMVLQYLVSYMQPAFSFPQIVRTKVLSFEHKCGAAYLALLQALVLVAVFMFKDHVKILAVLE